MALLVVETDVVGNEFSRVMEGLSMESLMISNLERAVNRNAVLCCFGNPIGSVEIVEVIPTLGISVRNCHGVANAPVLHFKAGTNLGRDRRVRTTQSLPLPILYDY